MPGDLAISVVIVTRDHAPEIGEALAALAPQLGPRDEVVLVDNASSDGTAEAAQRALPGIEVVHSGANVGFSAACNAGVERSGGELVLLLNPDCVVEDGCLAALRRTAGDRPSWGAWQAAVLLPGRERVNTAGNVVHFLGIGWSGGLDEPVSSLPAGPREVAFGSGAALVVRREAWDAVGGFEPRFFMYCEDLDLSLRLRLAGWATGVVPEARVVHDYAFAKGAYKWFYLERNRWWTVLGAYPAALLVGVLPALLAFEVVLLVVAARGGWLRPKLRAQAAVLRELPAILARRRRVQAARTVDAATFAGALVATLDSPLLAGARAVPGVSALLRSYWAVVRRLAR